MLTTCTYCGKQVDYEQEANHDDTCPGQAQKRLDARRAAERRRRRDLDSGFTGGQG